MNLVSPDYFYANVAVDVNTYTDLELGVSRSKPRETGNRSYVVQKFKVFDAQSKMKAKDRKNP